VPVVEKAWAFFHNEVGTYASIEGGNSPGINCFDALGVSTVHHDVTDYATATAFLKGIQNDLAAGKTVVLGGPGPLLSNTIKNNVNDPNTSTDENTYHRGAHSYMVDHVNTDANGNPVSVTLRNPWAVDGGVSPGDPDPSDGYVTIPANLLFYCSGGFGSITV